MKENGKKINWEIILFIAIMFVGVFVRLWRFGDVPGGINQDEAFAGYEAYSILHYGKDSFGYSMPVYLMAWGSGMNALNTYLMIPFIAVFGLKSWVIRMPQVIVAIFSLAVCYLLMKKLFDSRMGLISMFILAVVPWHIMLSRWGLESNLAPGFLLFGLYFFVKGLDKSCYFIISALMYGLSLYSYATIWPFVPIMILLQVSYAIYIKKIKFDKNTIISVIVLGVMALPLLLFLLVNTERIDEIRTSFISIPKLLYFRGGEMSLSNIPDNFRNILNIMINQTDGLITNVCDKYGIFYKITLFFFAAGLIITVYKTIKAIIKKNKSGYPFILIQFIGGFLLSLLISVNVNRANSLMIAIVFIAAIGVYDIVNLIDWRVIIIPAAVYIAMFVSFSHYYFTEYNNIAGDAFCIGFEDAVEDAMKEEGTIYISSGVTHPRVMFYSSIPVDEYMDTVIYNNYPGAFVGTDSFGRFNMNFDINTQIDTDGIYILDKYTDITPLENSGFTSKSYGNFLLLKKSD